MHPDLQKILALIDQNKIYEAFEELEGLTISNHTLAQLRQEFEGGFQGVNFVQRLKMVIKSTFKDRPQAPSPASFTLSQDKIEAYIAYLARILEQSKSTPDMPEPLVDKGFEKLLGDRSNLTNMNWFLKGLKASKSVCRVIFSNKAIGTGFVLKGGYLLTNYHVIEGRDDATKVRIEFNFEQGIDGKFKKPVAYTLNPEDCKFSTKEDLDYAYVKIKDNPAQPLAKWGFLEIEESSEPHVGEPTFIIQHPKDNGGVKQIAFENNRIISKWKQYLFYETDTNNGSSGSPVLNRDWKVVALHHFGLDEKQGGVAINEAGEKRPANRGVLMKEIMADIGKPVAGESQR